MATVQPLVDAKSAMTSTAMTAAVAAADSHSSSTAQSRRLLLKVDLVLMPLLVVAFGLQFWDKAVLGSAAVFGILTDLDLAKGKRFSTASSLFYVGYLVGAPLWALMALRWRLNLFLGGAIVLWGAILLLTPAITSWRGLYAQRVFLGFVEAAVSPGFVHITRSWYARREQSARIGIWYSATGLFSVFSGLVNFGLGSAAATSRSSGTTTIAAWKLIFLFPGALTVVFGLVVLLLLPPSPTEDAVLGWSRYNRFDAAEKRALQEKVRRNLTGMGRASWRRDHVLEAALDVKVWIFFLMAFAIYVTNGGVTVFGPILVKAIFNTTGARALALQAPGGATTAVSIYVSVYLASRIRHSRTWLLQLGCLVVLAGALMCWKADWLSQPGVAYAGYLLIPIFGAPYVMLLSLATANIGGPTKQAVATGAIFVGYCLGNIASGYILLPTEKSHNYPTTFATIVGVMAATVFLSGLLAAVMYLDNRRRDRRALPGGQEQRGFGQDVEPSGGVPSPTTSTKAHDDDDEDHGDAERRTATVDGTQGQVDVGDKAEAVVSVSAEQEEARVDDEVAAQTGFQGLTDRQNPHFRYVF